MELQKLSNMLTKLSVWRNIAPYYGTYSDWCTLLVQLIIETNQFWRENDDQFLQLDYDLFQDYREIMIYAEEFSLGKPNQNYMIDLEFDLYENFNNIQAFLHSTKRLTTDRLNSISFTSSFEYCNFIVEDFYNLIAGWDLSKLQSVTFKTYNFVCSDLQPVFELILPAAQDTVLLEDCDFPPGFVSQIYSLWYNWKNLVDLSSSVYFPEHGYEYAKHDYKIETLDLYMDDIENDEFLKPFVIETIKACGECGLYKNLKQLNLSTSHLNCKEVMELFAQHLPEGCQINEKYKP